MTPRRPPDRPDDDKPSELQPSVHKAPKDIASENENPVPKFNRDQPRLVKAEDVEVEVDRIEAYLRGPTAFTA
ncbi:hypothetical protein VB618_17225 [Microvirga sp. CF3062]|uniref:hypothetical protein n=1 Tax=Microvirga sp. CF3062 TaxID=3110182 RepID=UPI002E78B9FB|nr:hypothetical protein [Microvirga sp. CF3062]MEE1657945.1 hypothetical protein [Microvirga sp. CF3062]